MLGDLEVVWHWSLRPIIKLSKARVLHRLSHSRIREARIEARRLRLCTKQGVSELVQIDTDKRIASLTKALGNAEANHPGMLRAVMTSGHLADTGRRYGLSRQRVGQYKNQLSEYCVVVNRTWQDVVLELESG